MPIQISELAASGQSASGLADAFLAVKGKVQGPVKGECQSAGHVDEISILTWEWGMSSPTSAATGQASGRRIHEFLVVTKSLDSASTKLMNALATNEELKTVTLALRKSGMAKDDFFTIELETGRVVGQHIAYDAKGGTVEVVKFSFQKITVTFSPQASGGGKGGAMTFSDEWNVTT
jgi:type VI secretion system secreted protein Hcp